MSLLKKPSELSSSRPICGMIYGQPGVGKTTLALSAHNAVLIDADQGLHRVEKRFQVPSLSLKNYKDVIELFNSNDLDEFDTIIFDTVGKLVDKIGDYLVEINPKNRKSDGALTMQGYGALKVEFQKLFRLSQGKGKNLIYLAHEREEKDGETKIVRPDISGSSGKDLIKDLDFMGYMEMRGNKRTISFSPCEKFYAKNSIKLDPVIEIPNTEKGNTFIQDIIIAGMIDRMKEDDAQNKRYIELVESFEALLGMVVDPASANDALEKINATSSIWDSNMRAKAKLASKTKELGLVYNKDDKSFELATKAA